MGEKRIDRTPIDKPEEPAKVEQSDLETHARLEVVDRQPSRFGYGKRDAARPNDRARKEASSLWQAINRVFRKPVR